MLILFLPAAYPSEINPIGGVYIKEYAKAASLYNNIVVLYTYPVLSLKGLYSISETIEDGVGTIRVRYGGHWLVTKKLLYYWGIFNTFRRLVKNGLKPDVIHAHFFTAGAIAVVLGRIYKIPVIISEYSTNVATNSLGTFERRRLQFAMKRAQVIIACSHDLAWAIKNYYGINKEVQVVPCTVNVEVFHP